MVTGVQMEQLKKHSGLRHISALRSESIHQFIKDRLVECSIFDAKNIAEIVSNEYPQWMFNCLL
jgi:hypothetical protein